MQPEELLGLVLASGTLEMVLAKSGLSEREVLKEIHPDVCKLPDATSAVVKFTLLRKEALEGRWHEDDAGRVNFFKDHCIVQGDHKLLQRSQDGWQALFELKNLHFQRYLPSGVMLQDGEYRVNFPARALPLSALPAPLPQEHLNWILSRMLELSAWLESKGWSHNGFNPDSVYVVPETHGIIVTSYYHLTRSANQLRTVSGKYLGLYPAKVLARKTTVGWLDCELAKRTACLVGGDKTGIGVGLRGKAHPDWLKFVMQAHEGRAIDILTEYREMLKKNFPDKFCPLEV